MELEFLSNKYSLYHLEHFFCYLMEDITVTDELRHQMRLCFQEAVTNAVVHGNQCDESKYVHISMSKDDNKLVLSIKDEGEGFDMQQVRNPLTDENLVIPGGRGLFLMRTLSDHLQYDLFNRVLSITFNLSNPKSI